MQKGLSINELAARITAQQSMKHDFVASTDKLTMQIQRADAPGTQPVAVIESNETGESYPVRPIAHDQIGARLGIPSKYYDRMLADAPDLLATNVNAWFRQKPERRMVRTLGGDARAFLSDRYNRIENEEIAGTVLPILLGLPEVQIVSSEITERRLYIQAVTPRTQRDVKRGDAVQAGVIITNSEVGHGSVSVRPMIFRLVCLNGMVADDGQFRANHVGRRVEEGTMEAVYADDTRKADDRAVLLKVRDHVKHAVDEAIFAQRVEKMAALAESREVKNPVKTIEVLAQKLNLSESEGGDILTALAKGGDLSAWGVLNAITAQAHSPSISYDRAVEFESLGGKLLDLPKNQWSEILEAA